MFRTLDPFREFEKLAEAAFSPDGLAASNLFHNVAYDLVKFEDRFELHADLPDADPASIDLTVDGKDLTLTADRRFTVPEGGELVKSGRPQGSYKRVFHLSDKLDSSNLSANYDGGVLTVSIPLAPTAQPQKVTVDFTSADTPDTESA